MLPLLLTRYCCFAIMPRYIRQLFRVAILIFCRHYAAIFTPVCAAAYLRLMLAAIVATPCHYAITPPRLPPCAAD